MSVSTICTDPICILIGSWDGFFSVDILVMFLGHLRCKLNLIALWINEKKNYKISTFFSMHLELNQSLGGSGYTCVCVCVYINNRNTCLSLIISLSEYAAETMYLMVDVIHSLLWNLSENIWGDNTHTKKKHDEQE